MIARRIFTEVTGLLDSVPAVALMGPWHVGKTSLARVIAEGRPSIYLDLESNVDLTCLSEPELFLTLHEDKLVILDEIAHIPNLFSNLRGLIDRGRRVGRNTSRFLLVGSASIDLLKQTGETLAGRIAYEQMRPIDALEVDVGSLNDLWVRGGFPGSFLARSAQASLRWRQDFIGTYLYQNFALLGGRISVETLRRLWIMLAHRQGSILNAAELARALGVSSKTVSFYLDLLVDLLLIARLEPWRENTGKRLVKSPRIFVRDSGITHALLGLATLEDVLSHPVAGASWEGFVIETALACAPVGAYENFYRTSAGAGIDLVLTLPGDHLWAIEVRRTLSPVLTKGFHQACEDLRPERRILVYPGTRKFPLAHGVEVMSPRDLGQELLSKA